LRFCRGPVTARLMQCNGQTAMLESIPLPYATLDSSRHFGCHRDRVGDRSLAVSCIWTANLGRISKPAGPAYRARPGHKAAMPIPTIKITNRIDAGSMTLPCAGEHTRPINTPARRTRRSSDGIGVATAAQVQAITVAIDQYAEKARGNRDYFLNKPYGVG
jgi:hypothetical protein